MKIADFVDSDFRVSSLTKATMAGMTCVAVAIKPEGVAVRNSNDEAKTTTFFTHEEWKSFIGGVKKGEFDV